MSKSSFNEQFQRFNSVLMAKQSGFMDCEHCPIQFECYASIDTATIEEAENAVPCEEVLLKYILTGEKPS